MKHTHFYILLLGIVLFFSSPCCAQTFMKFSSGWIGGEMIEMADSTYLLYDVTKWNDSTKYRDVHLSQFNRKGDLLKDWSIPMNMAGSDTFVTCEPSNLHSICQFNHHPVLGVRLYNKNFKYHYALMQMDSSMQNILFMKNMNKDTLMTQLDEFLPISNNKLLIADDYQFAHVYEVDARLYELDSNFNIKWTKTFRSGVNDWVYPVQLIKAGNFYYLVLEYDTGFNGSYPNYMDDYILKLDTNGNTIWRKSFSDGRVTVSNMRIAPTADGNFIASWNSDYLVGSDTNFLPWIQYYDSSTISMAKFDANGNVLARKNLYDYLKYYYGLPRTDLGMQTDMCTTADGGHVFSGYVDYKDSIHGSSNVGGYVFKIDDDLNTQWFRYYSVLPDNDTAYTQTYFYSVKPTSDNALILGGEYSSNPCTRFPADTETAIAVKLDAEGCLQSYCGFPAGVKEINPVKRHTLTLSPNPAHEYISVRLEADQAEALRYTLYNSTGQQVQLGTVSYFSNSISIGALSPGVYSLQIYDSKNRSLYQASFVKE